MARVSGSLSKRPTLLCCSSPLENAQTQTLAQSRFDFLGFWSRQTGWLSRCLEPAFAARLPFPPCRPGHLGVLVVAWSPSEVLLCGKQECVLWGQPSQVWRGAGAGGKGGRACYQGDGAGRASALQIWSARAHSHGHVPPRKGRSEREGLAARRLHDRAPSSSGAGPSPWGRRRRGEGGARGKAFGAGCLPGFPSSLPACSPRPEPPSARRPVPGPAGDGEAVLTSRRGPCLGAGCGNVPGQWD